MAYTTPEAVANRVNPGRDTTAGLPAAPNSAEDVSPDVLEAAITDATSRIDSYLGGTYAVPFVEPVPGQIVSWATAIAAWFATLALDGQADITANNPVRLRFDAAMADLVLARDGKIEVVGGTGSTTGDDDGTVYNRLPEMFAPAEFGVRFSGGVPVVGGWTGGNRFNDYGGTGW